MVLSIQKFDYEITYKKGSDIIIADALSRAPVEDDNFQFNFSEVNLLEFLAVSEQLTYFFHLAPEFKCFFFVWTFIYY